MKCVRSGCGNKAWFLGYCFNSWLVAAVILLVGMTLAVAFDEWRFGRFQ